MTDDADRFGDDDLRRLCEAHGIETAYDDIWGHRHEVSPEAMRALLRDMGAFDRALLDAVIRWNGSRADGPVAIGYEYLMAVATTRR